MDYVNEDLRTSINLNVDPIELCRLAEQYPAKSNDAINGIRRAFIREISGLTQVQVSEVSQMKGLAQCQSWLLVIRSGYKELRASFLHAAFHYGRLEGTQYPRFDDPAYMAFTYFAEDVVIRAVSIGDKIAQLLNRICQLGLAQDKVSLNKIGNEAYPTEYVGALLRLTAAISAIRSYRNHHVHRFDPDIFQSSITSIETDEGEEFLLGSENSPMGTSEYFFMCRDCYLKIDQAITELFSRIDVASLRFR